MLNTLVNKTRLRFNHKFTIREVEVPYFFQGPNPKSSFYEYLGYVKNHLPKLIRFSPYSTFSRVIKDEQNEILVFYSAKCGSSSLKYFVKDYLNLFEWDSKMPLHAQKIPCLLSYDFKKNGEIFNWNTYHGYTKFLVMRDPYDRLVSYYSNRFLRQFIQRKAKQHNYFICHPILFIKLIN